MQMRMLRKNADVDSEVHVFFREHFLLGVGFLLPLTLRDL